LLADKEKLSATLTYHVLTGRYSSSKVVALDGKKQATVNGAELSVKAAKDGVVTLDGSSKIVQKDIKCKNGYVHVIDAVLIPK